MPLAGLLVGLKPSLWSKTTSAKMCTQEEVQLSDSNINRQKQGERCGTQLKAMTIIQSFNVEYKGRGLYIQRRFV